MSESFKARLHGGPDSYWELLSDGVRIATFTVQEIAGLYGHKDSAIKYIKTLEFGKLLLQAARLTKESQRILMILRKAVQCVEEEGLNG